MRTRRSPSPGTAGRSAILADITAATSGLRREDALEGDAEVERQVWLHVVVRLAAAGHRDRRIELRRGRPGENVVRRRRLVAVRAEARTPLSLTIATDVGDILLFARRYEEAAGECRGAIQMDPEFRQGHVELGRILKAQGDFEGAIREFLVSQRKDLLAAAYAMSGRREEALRLQAEIT